MRSHAALSCQTAIEAANGTLPPAAFFVPDSEALAYRSLTAQVADLRALPLTPDLTLALRNLDADLVRHYARHVLAAHWPELDDRLNALCEAAMTA